jgi:hypothetical protein
MAVLLDDESVPSSMSFTESSTLHLKSLAATDVQVNNKDITRSVFSLFIVILPSGIV